MDVFAGLPVRDIKAALPWYGRLFGEPSFFPNDAEAVWTLAAGHVYIIERPEDAGHGLVTLFGDDLDPTVEPDEVETYDNGVRKAIFRDPDGNEIGFASGPST